MLKCWETYFEKHVNTNWLISEEPIEDIPDNIPGLAGPPFPIGDIQKAAKAMKSKKAPGADRIGGGKMAEMFLKICNVAWHQEKLPTYWCRSMINPVHKIGYKLTPSNYRSISLIPFPGKVFCNMILMRIDDNIDTHLTK